MMQQKKHSKWQVSVCIMAAKADILLIINIQIAKNPK